MPSFDTVCEPDLVKVKNGWKTPPRKSPPASTSRAHPPALPSRTREITATGDAEFQLDQIQDVLRSKLAKQDVDVRFLDVGMCRRWAATRSSW